jgi:hypothetical protein
MRHVFVALLAALSLSACAGELDAQEPAGNESQANALTVIPEPADGGLSPIVVNPTPVILGLSPITGGSGTRIVLSGSNLRTSDILGPLGVRLTAGSASYWASNPIAYYNATTGLTYIQAAVPAMVGQASAPMVIELVVSSGFNVGAVLARSPTNFAYQAPTRVTFTNASQGPMAGLTINGVQRLPAPVMGGGFFEVVLEPGPVSWSAAIDVYGLGTVRSKNPASFSLAGEARWFVSVSGVTLGELFADGQWSREYVYRDPANRTNTITVRRDGTWRLVPPSGPASEGTLHQDSWTAPYSTVRFSLIPNGAMMGYSARSDDPFTQFTVTIGPASVVYARQ